MPTRTSSCRRSSRSLRVRLLAACFSAVALASCGRGLQAGPQIREVSPAVIVRGAPRTVSILGDNFFAVANVDLSSSDPIAVARVARVQLGRTGPFMGEVKLVDPHTVTFVTPDTLKLGVYDVLLFTPAGFSAEAKQSLTVRIDGGGTGGASASGGASNQGGTAGAFSLGGAPGVLTCGGATGISCYQELVPEIAECVDLTAPDPAYCESLSAPGEMAVDLSDMVSGGEQRIYLRFTIPAQPPIQNLASATLRLRTSTNQYAAGPASGDVWSVAPFDLAGLSQVPALLGGAPISANVGAVLQDQVVNWSLPVGSIPGPGGYYLGVIPNSIDGVHYYNRRSAVPPRLILNYAP